MAAPLLCASFSLAKGWPRVACSEASCGAMPALASLGGLLQAHLTPDGAKLSPSDLYKQPSSHSSDGIPIVPLQQPNPKPRHACTCHQCHLTATMCPYSASSIPGARSRLRGGLVPAYAQRSQLNGSWQALSRPAHVHHIHTEPSTYVSSSTTSQQQPAQQHKSDVIHIKGARFYGYHGVLPAENVVGQPFVVDLSLHCDLRQAGATDDLQHTVSYADVFESVQRIMEGAPVQLLETLAHRICHKVLAQHAMVQAVAVAVSKVHIPKLSAAVSAVGVEVYRTRADFNL